MPRLTIALALAAALLASSAQAACKPDPQDAPAVAQAMVAMYAAVTVDDYAAFHAVVAPDFYAYDGGAVFKGDALMDLLKAGHAAGKRYVWTVAQPQVEVACDTAWITYLNDGAVGDASGMRPQQWLESAVLTRQAGAWRIRFLHSTRTPPKQ